MLSNDDKCTQKNHNPFDVQVNENKIIAGLLLSNETLRSALRDPRLGRRHRSVLGAICQLMDNFELISAPSKTILVSMTGLALSTLERAIVDLKSWGYLLTTKKALDDPESKNKQTIYTLRMIKREDIELAIAAYVTGIREGKNQEKYDNLCSQYGTKNTTTCVRETAKSDNLSSQKTTNTGCRKTQNPTTCVRETDQVETKKIKKEKSPHTPLKEKNKRNPPKPPKATILDVRDCIQAYNRIAEQKGLQVAEKETDKRVKAIKGLLDRYGRADFDRMLQQVASSDFLQGRTKNFKAALDWLISPSNFVKVIEGNYANSKSIRFKNNKVVF